MKTILYLSPHLDDVVFSCLSHLLTQSTEGNRTIVATIFTEGDHDRRKEEEEHTIASVVLLWVNQMALGLICQH